MRAGVIKIMGLVLALMLWSTMAFGTVITVQLHQSGADPAHLWPAALEQILNQASADCSSGSNSWSWGNDNSPASVSLDTGSTPVSNVCVTLAIGSAPADSERDTWNGTVTADPNCGAEINNYGELVINLRFPQAVAGRNYMIDISTQQTGVGPNPTIHLSCQLQTG